MKGASAISKAISVFTGPDRREIAAIAQIKEFEEFSEGWDGYYGSKPNPRAIREAIRFVRVAGDLSTQLEPTLHADGSIILDIDGSARSSLEFRGDSQIVFSIEGAASGIVPFDGFVVPSEIRSSLCA